jgi:hypothetical protein
VLSAGACIHQRAFCFSTTLYNFSFPSGHLQKSACTAYNSIWSNSEKKRRASWTRREQPYSGTSTCVSAISLCIFDTLCKFVCYLALLLKIMGPPASVSSLCSSLKGRLRTVRKECKASLDTLQALERTIQRSTRHCFCLEGPQRTTSLDHCQSAD